jgi:DNA polymerase-3 subunit epsilon/CBS domain-containing protein
MSAIAFSTPLGSVAGVAFDTETTGLDARTARLLQIGAVKLSGSVIELDARFERLIDPGVPIPKASSAIHGITAADVVGAPAFKDVIADLEGFIGPAILIGHTLSYDMAILQREYALAGAVWRPPRLLDIRLLAEIAAPTLSQFDLDRICAWLGITIEARHTATGDALAAAQAFVALIPHLRERGVRTLAEAEAASRRRAEGQARAAGALPPPEAAVPDSAAAVLARVESYPYRHRVHEVMSAPPIVADANATVHDGLRLMLEQRVSSLYIRDQAGIWGIVTERDVLRALNEAGSAGLSATLGSTMSKPLQTVDEQEFVYRAIGRVQRLGGRHLGVCNAQGEVVGALTSRNLLQNRASTAIVLGDAIEAAPDTVTLGRAWAGLPLLARDLIAEDVDPRTIAAIISSEIRALTRRATQLAEQRMLETGKGPPPERYAVLVLGSAGRGESLLAADQDNAIVYEQGEPDGEVDRWFAELGEHMAATLDTVGVAYCKGGVMAKNAQWRMSLERWRQTIDGWVRRQRPEDLLNVDIFFDGTTAYGDVVLGEAVWKHAWDAGHRAPDFIKLLSEVARQWRSPITIFGRIRSDEAGRADLKKAGLMPIFTAARALAIRHAAPAHSTPERLRGVLAKTGESESDFEAVIDAHRVILGAMLAQQLIDTEAGTPPSSRVELRRLSPMQLAELKKALGRVETAIGILSEGRL